MKQLLSFLFLPLILAMPGQLWAQQGQCGNDVMLEKWIKENPDHGELYQQYLSELSSIANNTSQHLYKKKAVVTIPVVFHVIHNYGEENISKAQIEEQLVTLNKDFRRQNADTNKTRTQFKSRAVDVEVEFKLATKDPAGNCTDGITRTVSTFTYGGDEEVKKLVRWDYKKYLNIWVVNYIGQEGDNGTITAGYSRFPFQTSESTDGIILDHRFVGSTGTSNASVAGRTLTHEVGHWLGLLHPFQDGCGSTCANSGDRVCDTPPVREASFGCPTNNNTCTNDSPNELDNVENYMDYANGSCQNMFTAGQKNVMLFYLSGSQFRGPNISSSNLTATGVNISNPCAPKADFYVAGGIRKICQGGSVDFVDLSWNGTVVDKVWTFEGGSPSSSTFASPKVVYNNPGKYKVTLKVSNTKGESEVVKTAFIEVLPDVSDVKTPYREDFESEFSPYLWTAESSGVFGWKIQSGTSYSGSTAVICYIDQYTSSAAKFNLISPAIDLSLHKSLNPILSMRLAYSLRSSGAGERMIIYGSNDCGKSWQALKGLVGASSLFSKSGNHPGWKPTTAADWKVVDVNLKQHGFENSTHLMLRFELSSASGNSVYIDDINIDQFALSLQPADFAQEIEVYPNPSTGTFNIHAPQNVNNINIEILNPCGELIRTLVLDSSKTMIHIDTPGVYILRINNNYFTTSRKLVVTP